ncbi:MAG: hypothetical protein ACRC36_14775 [Lacrimispora sphenoides]
MVGICGLAQDVNKCPNYNSDTGSCVTNNTVCGFFRNSEAKKEKTEYKRKTRWYEQYYEK